MFRHRQRIFNELGGVVRWYWWLGIQAQVAILPVFYTSRLRCGLEVVIVIS
jgi:hypothetical protein